MISKQAATLGSTVLLLDGGGGKGDVEDEEEDGGGGVGDMDGPDDEFERSLLGLYVDAVVLVLRDTDG